MKTVSKYIFRKKDKIVYILSLVKSNAKKPMYYLVFDYITTEVKIKVGTSFSTASMLLQHNKIKADYFYSNY